MKLYELTLNPCDRYQYYNKEDRLDLFRRYVSDLLLDFKGLIAGVVCISLPEYGNQGHTGPRLHYHSICKFRCKEELDDFLLRKYYSLLRTTGVSFKVIGDIQKYKKYIEEENYNFYPEIGNIDISDVVPSGR